MTISKDASAPLFVVVGSTGGQGGSTIRALLASSKPYRVRAITRDALKPNAKALGALGCEVVEADVATSEGVKKAFEGTEIVFAMTLTDFSTLEVKKNEIAAGKLQVDGAKAAGVKTFIWSGMPHIADVSGGKNQVAHFESKAEVTTYARSLGGMKVIDVQPGTFFSNFFTQSAPRKSEDGSYVIAMALNSDTKLPVIDVEEDYGKYVVAALEDGSVETVLAAPEYVTFAQVAEAFSKASGKTVKHTRVPDEVLLGILKQARGEVMATNIVDMFRAVRECGYYGGADLAPSNKILPKPARKIDEMLAGYSERVAELFSK